MDSFKDGPQLSQVAGWFDEQKLGVGVSFIDFLEEKVISVNRRMPPFIVRQNRLRDGR